MSKVSKPKDLPFNIEHFLDIVGDASSRSRQFLLLLVFSGILIFIAIVNSFVPEYNWFGSRIQINQNILKFISCHEDEDPNRVNSLADFIIKNEALNGIPNDTFYKYNKHFLEKVNSKYPKSSFVFFKNPQNAPVIDQKFSDRKARYFEIGNAYNFVISHNILNKESLKGISDQFEESKIEHFDLVRVPILGVSFDVNYLGVYSGLILSTLYFLLYFSLFREYISLKIAFKRAWMDIKQHHYYFYEYVSMLQVLSVPQKLFSPFKKINFFYVSFPVAAIAFPALAFVIVYFYDLSSFEIGYETNAFMTIVSTIISTVFLILIISTLIYIARLWRKMDRFWNNQTYEFNFEYILECIGEDPDVDLLDFSNRTLYEEQLDLVKKYWHHSITNFYNDKAKITKKSCMKMFGKFINDVLSLNMECDELAENQEKKVEESWKTLTSWFKMNGRKNIGSGFRDSFFTMIMQNKPEATGKA